MYGLVLLFFPPSPSKGRLCVAVMLIGIGQAGRKPSLQAFLADQLKKRVQCLSQADQEVKDLIRHWWRFFRFWGATAAFLVAGFSGSWPIRLTVSACVMGVTFILLLLGIHHYHYEPPIGSPLSLRLIKIFRKVKVVIFNKHLPHPPTHDYETGENDREEKTPAREIPLNRSLFHPFFSDFIVIIY
ncbi:unnamed protein product [Ilex paraguariensis]|uniref:Uncharacterized protein n=1 Tax=Ilex paraguariensis TaxID=185542 RepID=A0ABC8RQD6_9AQUA